MRAHLKCVLPFMARLRTGSEPAELLMKYYWDTIDQCVPPESILAPGPWLSLGRRIARMQLRRLAWALGRRPPSLSDRARFQRNLGNAMGQLSGALVFRVAPPRPERPE